MVGVVWRREGDDLGGYGGAFSIIGSLFTGKARGVVVFYCSFLF